MSCGYWGEKCRKYEWFTLTQNDFRRDVLWGAKDLLVAKLFRRTLQEICRQTHQSHFAQSEVRQLDVSQGGD